MSKLTDYLPTATAEKMLVQARIPMDLGQEVRKAIHDRDLSWSDFVTAACQKYLEEIKAEKGKKS